MNLKYGSKVVVCIIRSFKYVSPRYLNYFKQLEPEPIGQQQDAKVVRLAVLRAGFALIICECGGVQM